MFTFPCEGRAPCKLSDNCFSSKTIPTDLGEGGSDAARSLTEDNQKVKCQRAICESRAAPLLQSRIGLP